MMMGTEMAAQHFTGLTFLGILLQYGHTLYNANPTPKAKQELLKLATLITEAFYNEEFHNVSLKAPPEEESEDQKKEPEPEDQTVANIIKQLKVLGQVTPTDSDTLDYIEKILQATPRHVGFGGINDQQYYRTRTMAEFRLNPQSVLDQHIDAAIGQPSKYYLPVIFLVSKDWYQKALSESSKSAPFTVLNEFYEGALSVSVPEEPVSGPPKLFTSTTRGLYRPRKPSAPAATAAPASTAAPSAPKPSPLAGCFSRIFFKTPKPSAATAPASTPFTLRTLLEIPASAGRTAASQTEGNVPSRSATSGS